MRGVELGALGRRQKRFGSDGASDERPAPVLFPHLKSPGPTHPSFPFNWNIFLLTFVLASAAQQVRSLLKTNAVSASGGVSGVRMRIKPAFRSELSVLRHVPNLARLFPADPAPHHYGPVRGSVCSFPSHACGDSLEPAAGQPHLCQNRSENSSATKTRNWLCSVPEQFLSQRRHSKIVAQRTDE